MNINVPSAIAAIVQDTADLSRMLGLASEEELARVRAVVARYAPADTEDLESLIYLGQTEMIGEQTVL